MTRQRRPGWTRWALAALLMGLVFSLGFARGEKSDPKKKFDAIVQRADQAQQDYDKALKDAADKAEADKLREKRPGLQFLAEFKSLAAECKGTETAALCWMKVARIASEFGKSEESVLAVDTLVAGYITSPALVDLPGLLPRLLTGKGKEKIDPTLRTLIAKSPEKAVQAGALYTLAMRILSEKDAPKDRVAEARAMLDKISKDYAGIKSPKGVEYKDLAESYALETDHLQIGKEAPDFEATDENGTKFKLSDYRGKVVVVDFWGIW